MDVIRQMDRLDFDPPCQWRSLIDHFHKAGAQGAVHFHGAADDVVR